MHPPDKSLHMHKSIPRHILTLAAVAFLAVLLPAAGWAHAAPQSSAARADDEAAIRLIVANFSDGWNRHDAHAMFAALADDGDFVTWQGMEFHGRKAYEDYHAMLLAGPLSQTHRTDAVKSIRFLTPDIALVEDDWSMTGAKNSDGSDWPYREGYIDMLMTRQNGRWMVTVSHVADFNAKQPAPSARPAPAPPTAPRTSPFGNPLKSAPPAG